MAPRAVPATIFDSLFSDPFFSAPLRPVRTASRPGPSVHRGDGRVLVTMDLPGLRPEDVQLTVTPDGDGAVVAVRGERRDARGTRSVRWSAHLRGVDAEAVSGDLTDGVLTVSAPELAAPAARRVELTTGAPVAEEPALETAGEPAVEAADPDA